MTESKDLQEFISKYLERGFGSMNKNDFEVWIFHYLMNHQLQGKTNYEVSLFLKIPETKVKRLRYEAELKYNDGDSLVNYHKVCALLKAVHFKKGGQCIQFTIEDLYLRKYLDSTLKSGGRFSDSSFNSYNPQNEMFSHFGTKRYNFKNETQLFKVIPHTSKNQKKSTGFAGTKYI